MREKVLDVWFNNLDYEELSRLFVQGSENDNDFIDNCDECWSGLSLEEKESMYLSFN